MASWACRVTSEVCPTGESMLARSVMIRAVVAHSPSMMPRWSAPGPKMSSSTSSAVRASAS